MTTYVFDNSPLSVLFKNFYRSRFPTLWAQFDALVDEGRILSTREALREIEDGASDECRAWAARKSGLFASPTGAEGAFVAGIFAVPHFQQNIEQRKILQGGKNADPFVIARAAVANATVVTMESLRPNGTGIPNICDHFNVPWLSLEQFMEAEGWTF
jgi:hypothetical protein